MTALSLRLSFWAAIVYGAATASATYSISDVYNGDNFFSKFNFFTADDPNHGFVDYQSQTNAIAKGLISNSSSSVRFGVDSTNTYSESARGRPSVRIESIASYNEGLFLFDVKHMPGDACGIWPAMWTLGSGTWPQNGEIDIVEGVNLNSKNQYTLHSGDGVCTVTGADGLGTTTQSNCQTTDNGTIINTTGCSIQAGTANSYGDSFNANGGGKYVMQWTSSFIKIWFFSPGQEPSSLSSSSPDVSQFGTPDANFQGCDIGSHFKDNRLIFLTNFCGDWAAADGVYQSQCSITVPNAPAWQSCKQMVAEHPQAYTQAYWEINSITVFSES